MAGIYPDVPAPRLAYDIDGTSVLVAPQSTNLPSDLSLANKKALNDEGGSTELAYDNGGVKFIFIFPTNTTIYGYFISYTFNISGSNPTLQYSNDTTDGINGTWTSITNPAPTSFVSQLAPFYRNNIQTLVTPVSAKALRVYGGPAYTEWWRSIHFYGIPNTPQKLDFWHPTLDQALTGAYFDFGDIAQGTSNIKQFRLKNFSTLNAGNVKISIDALSETSPTIASQHSLSLDGTTWFNYLDLPETSNIAIKSVNDAPNNISPIIYLKRNTVSNAALGLYTGRIIANVGEWL